jgi:hypothetical protein
MKTFFQFMEQILTTPQAKVDAAKAKESGIITRQHNRYANLQRLHTTLINVHRTSNNLSNYNALDSSDS